MLCVVEIKNIFENSGHNYVWEFKARSKGLHYLSRWKLEKRRVDSWFFFKWISYSQWKSPLKLTAFEPKKRFISLFDLNWLFSFIIIYYPKKDFIMRMFIESTNFYACMHMIKDHKQTPSFPLVTSFQEMATKEHDSIVLN